MLLGLPWPATLLRALLNDWYLRTRSRHEVAVWAFPVSACAMLVCPARPAQATTVATTIQNRGIPVLGRIPDRTARSPPSNLAISTSSFNPGSMSRCVVTVGTEPDHGPSRRCDI